MNDTTDDSLYYVILAVAIACLAITGCFNANGGRIDSVRVDYTQDDEFAPPGVISVDGNAITVPIPTTGNVTVSMNSAVQSQNPNGPAIVETEGVGWSSNLVIPAAKVRSVVEAIQTWIFSIAGIVLAVFGGIVWRAKRSGAAWAIFMPPGSGKTMIITGGAFAALPMIFEAMAPFVPIIVFSILAVIGMKWWANKRIKEVKDDTWLSDGSDLDFTPYAAPNNERI